MHAPHPVQKAALSSVLAAFFLTLFKIIVGFQTHSLGILAEAAHSGMDLMATLITYWAVSLSAKPADEQHHFGHGKIENIAALIETFLLWITCAWILKEVFDRLTGIAHPQIELSYWAFLVIGISIIIDFFRARNLYKVSKEYNSPALAADALHFRSDLYSSVAVLLGLIGAAFKFPIVDSLAALLVAAWTFMISLKLAKDSIDHLLDKAPDGADNKLLELLQKNAEIKLISSLKVRQSGSQLFVDLTVSLDKNMTFEKAHSLTEDIEKEIKNLFSNAIISIHPEPI